MWWVIDNVASASIATSDGLLIDLPSQDCPSRWMGETQIVQVVQRHIPLGASSKVTAAYLKKCALEHSWHEPTGEFIAIVRRVRGSFPAEKHVQIIIKVEDDRVARVTFNVGYTFL